jgi:aminopeptidase-like protein
MMNSHFIGSTEIESNKVNNAGNSMHLLARQLWPINRSITGEGVRKTLSILGEYLPGLQIHEIPSGTRCFDWTVPREWRVLDAWIKDSTGKKVVDFTENNLHLVGYSIPTDVCLTLEELQKHLHSLPEQPDAIPYITSYYSERWGFCISQHERDRLRPGQYQVHINSELFDGSLTYGELYLPGQTDREILLSTYVCHPSMANNELSGPCVATWLGRWLKEYPQRRFSYRILFLPETIGAIYYLSRNLEAMKSKLVAGFVLTCLGDDRAYSYLPSLIGDTIADRVAKHVLHHIDPEYKKYTFLDRGSDERQYCSPGVDLHVCSIMRSKYGTYPEYHTSLDNLELVTPTGLEGGLNAYKNAIICLEKNCIPMAKTLGEPQLGKRGLYPTLSTRESGTTVKNILNLIAYSNGKRTLLEIAEIIDVPMWELASLANQLSTQDVLLLNHI